MRKREESLVFFVVRVKSISLILGEIGRQWRALGKAWHFQVSLDAGGTQRCK